MEEAKVDAAQIEAGLARLQPQWLLPVNYLMAARQAPRWEASLERLMLQGLALAPKLPGHTVLVVDVSGSMGARLSGRSKLTRLDAGAALAVLGRELCESVTLYATAGSDSQRKHRTECLPDVRGFALARAVTEAARNLGSGGIFTRQCLEFLRGETPDAPERIIVFSDSQDCDFADKRVAKPFGKRNYIVDISAHTRGINYEGAWTAELSGWSEHFLSYIAAQEGLSLPA
jgi:60 kDa SS-A/Ro ribonucleoprotein